ncbi:MULTISPECIES: hypothetical protein [Haloferax]|uniref:Uncharacterized protein n=2 Tax=Haloferax TaxID=2251 RepID=A0A6G1Z290_9EURY|nr:MULTISPECIES: hypothetical protein [Haloferax]KAB1187753.1 hypothetical protein Hfx1149_06770 [Haloferax sp. CBA1149]MRW80414.1 hypothetical protein [Haloferax marinisediminis]
MESHALSAFLADELTYPIDVEGVVEHVGDVEVDAPDADNSETIATILTPLGTATFESADDLYTTIIGNLSDDYIGRKFYDDRGADPAESWRILPDQAVSF